MCGSLIRIVSGNEEFASPHGAVSAVACPVERHAYDLRFEAVKSHAACDMRVVVLYFNESPSANISRILSRYIPGMRIAGYCIRLYTNRLFSSRYILLKIPKHRRVFQVPVGRAYKNGVLLKQGECRIELGSR